MSSPKMNDPSLFMYKALGERGEKKKNAEKRFAHQANENQTRVR